MDNSKVAGGRKLLLATEWNSYAANVLPANATATQRVECRRAFFAGAGSLYQLMMKNLSGGPNGEVTTEDLAIMRDLSDEVVAFVEGVRNGRG